MKLTIEMDQRGSLTVTDENDFLDVSTATFLLELAKMHLMGRWMEAMESGEASIETVSPVVAVDDEVSI